MARRRRTDATDVPARLRAFDPQDWGPGDEGVDRWKRACLDWLNDNPGRVLPFGEAGDVLDAIREALRLKGAYGQPSRSLGLEQP